MATAVAILATAFAVLAPSAFAATATPTYTLGSSYGALGSGDGQLHLPTRAAVDPATGNVLIVDSANERVQVLTSDGTFLASFATGAGSGPLGIAIDQSSGAAYVSEGGTSQEIVRYVSDGAPVPTYTPDPTFTNPPSGSGAGEVGEFGSPIAVDPTTHDLLIADIANKRVSRLSTSGAFVSSFDGADTAGGAFTGLRDLAVGPTGTI